MNKTTVLKIFKAIGVSIFGFTVVMFLLLVVMIKSLDYVDKI